MRHVISVLMQNEVGALTRLTCLFSTRGYNIESLNVAPTEEPSISRLTLVTTGSDAALEQIAKQIGKLIDVVDMSDMTLGDHFERELALIKMRVDEVSLTGLRQFCEQCGASVLDPNARSFTVEYAGSTAEVDQFVGGLGSRCEIATLVRSGSVGISRGDRVLAGEVLPSIASMDEAPM